MQGCGFKTIEKAQYIINLLIRHWNHIAGTLLRGEVHVPLVFDNEDAFALGNEWTVVMRQSQVGTEIACQFIQRRRFLISFLSF